MLHRRALPLVLAWSSLAAAEDQVTLKLDWPEGARWRVIDQWELETTGAEGTKAVRSGVVRNLWTWEPTADGRSLIVRQPVLVRASPREDATSKAISRALLEPWKAVVSWDASAPTPRPTPTPTPVEPAIPVEAATPVDGAPAEVAPVEAPAVPPAEVASLEPSPAVPLPPVPSGADPVAFVKGDPVERFLRIFGALDGASLTPGRVVFDLEALAEPGAEVSVKVDRLALCPDVGPGSRCVEVTVRRHLGGATAEGAALPAGAYREQEVWVLDPTTLQPHGARIEAFSGWSEGEGKPVQQAHALHVLSFWAPEPPGPVSR